MFLAGRIREPHAQPGVIGKDHDEQRRQIKHVAVDVLNDEREITFAEIGFARLADGAVDRVGPERLVIGAAIIIAGETETGRCPQNQKRRRERQPARPPRRQRADGVRRNAPEFRRVKRREIIRAVAAKPIGAGVIVHVAHALKRGPSGINDEGGETEKDGQRLEPPGIGTGRFAEWALLGKRISVSHNRLK